MMILVTGATGTAGSEVVRALAARGASVRAFVRDPARARESLGEGIELAVGDFADAESLRAALAGVDQVFLSCSDDPRRVDWEARAIDAAVEAGVRRVLKLSAATAELGSPVAFWDWHARVEDYLRQSSVAWIVLRPGWYMTNLLLVADQVASEGRLYAPAGGARIAMIDPRDVGAAAAAVLTTPGHERCTYVITGPEAITYARVAAELTAATGSDIEFVEISDADARRALVESGLPDGFVEQLVTAFAMLRRGVGAHVTSTVESLTGRRARDLASFARDRAAVFTATFTREEEAA